MTQSITFDKEAYLREGFSEDEIAAIYTSLLEFENTGISYSHEEIFDAIRSKKDISHFIYA